MLKLSIVQCHLNYNIEVFHITLNGFISYISMVNIRNEVNKVENYDKK